MISRSCSNIGDELMCYIRVNPNVATEFISDIRRGTTYPNIATEFISDIRTGTTYPNVATEFIR
jgi:hypothetical protein